MTAALHTDERQRFHSAVRRTHLLTASGAAGGSSTTGPSRSWWPTGSRGMPPKTRRPTTSLFGVLGAQLGDPPGPM